MIIYTNEGNPLALELLLCAKANEEQPQDVAVKKIEFTGKLLARDHNVLTQDSRLITDVDCPITQHKSFVIKINVGADMGCRHCSERHANDMWLRQS